MSRNFEINNVQILVPQFQLICFDGHIVIGEENAFCPVTALT
jgi:hypothetical protein